MAAYAALVSLMHIIDQIQNHPRPPISLDKEQVESLTENVTFLQEFLEGYSHHVGYSPEADGLESRIADAAYAAEDVIEFHIVNQIHAGSTSHGEKISSIEFYQVLQRVIECMDFIKKEAMEIIEEKMEIQDQQQRYISAGSLGSPSARKNRCLVGIDDVSYEVMDKLTGGQPDRQIISITGMGGIGKTTLAGNIYENQVVVQYFDILAWVTISQEYKTREILLELILCLKSSADRESLRQQDEADLSQKDEAELGEILYKSLSGKRYLIVMDDTWSIEAWDKVKFFFPDNNNGSKIMITTRMSNLAFELRSSHIVEMNFLDEDKSWDLLCKNVFGKGGFPLELEEIGKKIAKGCKGLPMSIVVIGGLLAKSKKTQECWEYIAENLNSVVNLEDNERCLQILRMSYNQLPIHLKPCFLYMGVFREDSKIRVSELIKLMVAEGFLKPINGKSLEEAAELYLKELVDRNLILVHKMASIGKPKFFKIHDHLRDLCLREAQKQKFLCVVRQHSPTIPQGIHTERRIASHESTTSKEYRRQILHALQSQSRARSLITDFKGDDFKGVVQLFNFRLLRVFAIIEPSPYDSRHCLDDISMLYNSRYIAYPTIWMIIPSSICRLWNLQTLIVRITFAKAPSEIWKMPLLRHVEFDTLCLSDPPNDGTDDFVLGNLQTLLTLSIPDCCEHVFKRMPNIKKLKVVYALAGKVAPGNCINNLGRLHQLESLDCLFRNKPIWSELQQNLTFPHSLKKLTLQGCRLRWEDMTTKIGSLPHLEVLKLKMKSFKGTKWETVEGQFCSLKFLQLDCCGLVDWITDSTHFPRLEHLHLRDLYSLKEIPEGIGDTPTLQSIQLDCCSYSAVFSAKRILEEQEGLGNEGLQVRVVDTGDDNILESLASQNFRVEIRNSLLHGFMSTKPGDVIRLVQGIIPFPSGLI